MRFIIKLSLLLPLLLSACNFPALGTTAVPLITDTAPARSTDTPTQEFSSTECGFIWARETLEDLSKEFDAALKALDSKASGRAEAYGENCLNDQGEVVRFLAMETDFYVTLKVDSVTEKQILGELLEQVIRVVAHFPVETTPGPQPGYVGIDFEGPGGDALHLWFPQSEGESALQNGLRGEDLLGALESR